ncbi:phosphoribosyltransferase family protein [Pseudodesulfovibrio tunisiensis]|uniref:phosphoribosyltransferase family protein n=1 Tax=Pseudodesulfovibrio tunisiensis TaxID=463192 RepID=UPI001FB3CAE5|nr:phosphoribosyltransferase family protein [Pseudodesulfovibrio tunisiensis]
MNVLGARESGEKFRLAVKDLPYEIEIPFVTMPSKDGGVKIASFNLVGQIRLNQDLGKLMAAQIREAIGDMEGVAILTVVEKALQITQVVATDLGLDAVAVAYNRVKPHMEAESRPVIQVGSDSITSGSKFLAVYERDLNLLAEARGVILIDDVVSSGGTILGLADLMHEIGRQRGKEAPEILGIFCVAQEGDKHPYLPAPLHSLATLPKPVRQTK